ncbi:MAG: precorrin-6y C5,15-methyltransferase (decarboxylating) subunit CbiE [Thermodesulfobacteriota bacterium]
MAVTGTPITIVGCGPGAPEYVTPAAFRAAMEADVLVGAERLLELFPESKAERIPLTSGLAEVLDRIAALLPDKKVAVLVTGDPGLFSLSKLVIARFGREFCEVIPGISSVQVAFARLGLEWSDAVIISAHKQDPQVDPEELCRSPKIAIFCGREEVLPWIATLVQGAQAADHTVFVMEDLTLATERVVQVATADLPSVHAGPRTIVVLVRKHLLL